MNGRRLGNRRQAFYNDLPPATTVSRRRLQQQRRMEKLAIAGFLGPATTRPPGSVRVMRRRLFHCCGRSTATASIRSIMNSTPGRAGRRANAHRSELHDTLQNFRVPCWSCRQLRNLLFRRPEQAAEISRQREHRVGRNRRGRDATSRLQPSAHSVQRSC